MTRFCNKSAGFTLVELTLSITFLVVLSLSIVFTSIYVVGIYNKGSLLKEVHQVGREITDDLRRTFSEVSVDFDPASGTNYHRTNSQGPGGITSGRICTGKYSYLWNTPWGIKNASDLAYSNNIIKNNSGGIIRFVKVPDATKAYCASSNTPVVPVSDINKGGDLLAARNIGLRNLAVHGDIAISKLYDSETRQLLFTLSFTIGSDDMALINSTSCKPPADLGPDSNYCAINSFNITARSKLE